jgi:hypothetical protein
MRNRPAPCVQASEKRNYICHGRCAWTIRRVLRPRLPLRANRIRSALRAHTIAAAIHGMLTRRQEIWEDLFGIHGVLATSVGGDKWGTNLTKSVQGMLSELTGQLPTDGNASCGDGER